MKKIYISLFAASLASGVVAQSFTSPLLPAGKNTEISTKVKPSGQNYKKGAILWSNNCDNISDWTLIKDDVGGTATTVDWTIETDAMASPRTEFQPFMFTSVGDGFLFIDSDAAGSVDINATIEYTAAIDMSANTAINLVYETAYRNYQEIRTVQVSGDNGSTWTDYVIHDGASAVNTNTANPETTVINISAVAGGQSQVKFRFKYEGNFDWFWSIDDVRIEVTDDNDLRVDNVNFRTMGSYGIGLPYYQVPVAQAQPIEFYSVVTNIGALNQTNTTLTADVTGAGTFTGTSAAGFTSVVGSTDTIIATTMFTPASAGTYNIDYDVMMDNADINAANNSGALAFDLTTNIYARDNGVSDGGSFNQGAAYELGNVFDIFANQDLYGCDIKLSTSTEGNPLIFAKLYKFDAIDGTRVFVDQTDDYSVTAAEITAGAEITLAFNGPITLTATDSYLLVVGSYGDGGATNDLVIATAGESEPQTSNLYDEPTTTWFYVTGTPWVRMNFDGSASVEEIVEGNVTVSQNFPNPFTGNTTVNYTLTSNDEVTVEITDVTGKVIEVMNEGVRTAGSHTLTINSNKLAAGTYYYSVSTSNGKVTKSMNVTK